MLGVPLMTGVVVFLFWGVLVSTLHLEFFQALVLMLPLMLLVCLLGNEVQSRRPFRIDNQRKRDIDWPNVGLLAAELWWVTVAFCGLVVAIRRLDLVLALVATLMLWLGYALLMRTLKDIRARRGEDKE